MLLPWDGLAAAGDRDPEDNCRDATQAVFRWLRW